ncbi:MAG: biopolymer transporter ExbD [Gammaproteobacteria bacterium]|nr:biopolymer transporter ExbD [Gammaproteobacteria bacterium]
MESNGSAQPLPRLANNARRRRPLISLTPLIDVVFILLVFFMLASSFLDWRSIDLSAPARATAATTLEGALLVELRPEGIRLSGESLSLDALAARVAERVARRPDQRVLVRPARGVPLEAVVDVLDRLAGAGVRSLSLVRSQGG